MTRKGKGRFEANFHFLFTQISSAPASCIWCEQRRGKNCILEECQKKMQRAVRCHHDMEELHLGKALWCQKIKEHLGAKRKSKEQCHDTSQLTA